MSLAIRKIRLNQRGRSMSQTAERMRRATPNRRLWPEPRLFWRYVLKSECAARYLMPPANGSTQPMSITAENRRKNARLHTRLAEDHHMQPFRPVRAAHDGLLDIGGARRPADQIDAARQIALAIDRAQTVEALLVAADHIAGLNQDEMGLGQEGERRRIVSPRDEDQGSGFRRGGDGTR